jgi:hypothetical protein
MTPTNILAIAPKLSKMLLMLSSRYDGHVIAAARAITKILQDAGSDWHDLIAAMLAPVAHLEVRRDVVQWCLSRRFFLSYLEGVAEQRSPLSPKQKKWVRDVVAKLGSGEAA